jgi:formate dehydrogenase
VLLRLCRQPGFKKLLKHPNGWLRADHKENDFLGKRVYTKNKKVDLAPSPLMAAAEQRLQAIFNSETSKNNHFKLITKRTVTTQNSWTHNTERMLRGTENTNFLYLHPEDAKKLKLKAGDLADVSTQHARLRIPVKMLEELMPGTVSIPHGWGHQDAKGMQIASKAKGVNVNILAASGPEFIDDLSGMSKLTALEVSIEPAKGPQANTWSGLPFKRT